MQRFLIWLSLLAAVPLAGCWHDAFHTSVENATGQRIYVTIHFNVEGIPVGHGYVEPGSGVDFPQGIEKIDHVDYQFNGRTCTVDKQTISGMAHIDSQGVNRITLRDCGKAGAK
jgi:hypothetical protein